MIEELDLPGLDLSPGRPSRPSRPSRLRRTLDWVGGAALLAAQALGQMARPPYRARELVRQMDLIGLKSLPVAVLTAVFSGMVMTIQFVVQLERFGSKDYVGSAVALSLVRELGPVLTAVMVGGRVGAGIAAELGSMAVTEQLDAMRSMGADPIRSLVVPRVLATVIALPLLTVVAVVLGGLGAMCAAAIDGGVSPSHFVDSALHSLLLSDLLGGLIKTLFFGFFIGGIACYQGLRTEGGTEGVGRTTTETVVIASVTIFVVDFFLTSILLGLGM